MSALAHGHPRGKLAAAPFLLAAIMLAGINCPSGAAAAPDGRAPWLAPDGTAETGSFGGHQVLVSVPPGPAANGGLGGASPAGRGGVSASAGALPSVSPDVSTDGFGGDDPHSGSGGAAAVSAASGAPGADPAADAGAPARAVSFGADPAADAGAPARAVSFGADPAADAGAPARAVSFGADPTAAGVPVLGADPIPAAGTSVPGSDPIPADGTSGPGADPAPASGTPVAGVDPAPAAGTSLPGADPSGAGPGAAAEAAAPGAPAEAEPDPDAERQRAYERSLAELLPSSPEEILGWRRRADQREAALGDSPLGAMRTRTQPVRLEPGLVPPLVELTPNLVTALVFTDAAGRPWPIASSVLGSASLFKAEVLGGESASQIILSPAGNHGRSNLIVTLRDQQVPLVIRLEARSALDGGRRVDGLIIFQIQASGPQSDPDAALAEPGSPAGGRPPAGVVGEALYAVLDGLLPEGGRILAAVPALDGETVVQTETSMFLRTRRGLLWPAPRARVSGPGGLSVFEIPATPTVLLAMGEDVVELSIPEADLGPDRAREDGRW